MVFRNFGDKLMSLTVQCHLTDVKEIFQKSESRVSVPLGYFRTWNLKIRPLVKMWFWNNLIWRATGDNLCTGRTEYIPGRNQIKKGWSNQFCILGHFKQNLRTANLTRPRWTSNVFNIVSFNSVTFKPKDGPLKDRWDIRILEWLELEDIWSITYTV